MLKSNRFPLGNPDDINNLPDSLEAQDLQSNKTYARLSPRLGVAFPLDEKTLLRFNYGQFYQQPNLQDLYVSYRFLEYKINNAGYFVGFGNPNLNYNGFRFFQISDVNVGLLVILGVTSIGVYGIALSGWSSNNKYSLLGSIRASAQLISYELALTLSVLAAVIPVSSFQLSDVVEYQRHHVWNVVPQIVGFVVFLVAAFAETNRLPFDLPEAESELIAGFHTEYGAMRFALFFQGEYSNMAALSALGATLFFGGWSLPFIHYPENLLGGVLGLLTLVAKIAIAMAVFVWVRWTFPRFRYDQLMRLGWVFFFEIALVNIFLMAFLLAYFPPK